MELSYDQAAVVARTERAVVCLASPGSGKTHTLTAVIADRIERGEVQPSEVLALTFTRLAAAQLRTRLRRVLGDRSRAVTIGTFHGVAYEVIRQNWKAMGFASPEIAVYDRSEQKALIKETIFTSRYSCSVTAVLREIDGLAENFFVNINHDDAPRDVAAVGAMYRRALIEHNALDYSLIPFVFMEGLRSGKIVTPWRDIFVDEAQDLDRAQHWAFERMRPTRIFFVGDIDQMVYGWRGASFAAFRTAMKSWQAAQTFLPVNYRSGARIVGAAQELIRHNVDRFDKGMRPADGAVEGEVRVRPEAELTEAVRALPEGSVAVLARTNDEVAAIATHLAAAGIECERSGRRDKVLERPDVKLALAYLIWPEWAHSPVLMARVLTAEGLSDLWVEQIRSVARRFGVPLYKQALLEVPPLAEFYREIEHDGLMERLVMIQQRMNRYGRRLLEDDRNDLTVLLTQFLRSTHVEQRGADRFAAWLSLRDAQDEVCEGAVRCQVLTIHAAKGLEFDHVVVGGLHDRLLPHKRCHGSPAEIEEERRLLYVAITRARQTLTLLVPPEQPSRFLAELLSTL